VKPFRASLTLIAVALATTLVVSGCGSSSEETGDGTTAPAGTEATGTPPPDSSPSGVPSGVRAKACGSAGKGLEAVRVTGVGCAAGRKLASSWADSENCTIPAQASRGSCRVQGRVCLSALTDRGVAVTCAAPGKSVSFIARRR
jgi:hypothetical protein